MATMRFTCTMSFVNLLEGSMRSRKVSGEAVRYFVFSSSLHWSFSNSIFRGAGASSTRNSKEEVNSLKPGAPEPMAWHLWNRKQILPAKRWKHQHKCLGSRHQMHNINWPVASWTSHRRSFRAVFLNQTSVPTHLTYPKAVFLNATSETIILTKTTNSRKICRAHHPLSQIFRCVYFMPLLYVHFVLEIIKYLQRLCNPLRRV